VSAEWNVAGDLNDEEWPISAMEDDEKWVVRLHSDDIATAHSIVYALHRIMGMPVEEAWKRMAEWQRSGTADVTSFRNHMEAENLVERFLVFGVQAAVVQG
jgi:ATP-dependent Clp protease adapter protein ClpS